MKQWMMIVITALAPSICFLAFVIFTTARYSEFPPRYTTKERTSTVQWFKTKYPERVLLEGVANVR